MPWIFYIRAECDECSNWYEAKLLPQDVADHRRGFVINRFAMKGIPRVCDDCTDKDSPTEGRVAAKSPVRQKVTKRKSSKLLRLPTRRQVPGVPGVTGFEDHGFRCHDCGAMFRQECTCK